MNGKVTDAARKRVEGSLTEALGKLTGDKDTEALGAARRREAQAEHEAAATGTGDA